MSSEYKQDEIADKFLKGKTEGFFVDIGASYPETWNNSVFFEKTLNYRGVAVEMDQNFCKNWPTIRPNTILINDDATKVDYKKVLQEANAPSIIDFLSVDIDPNTATWEALLKVMDTPYQFNVIAFEVDYGGDFVSGKKEPIRFSVRDPSRAFLASKGYVLVREIYAYINPSYHVDDIWVHKSIYDYNIELKL